MSSSEHNEIHHNMREDVSRYHWDQWEPGVKTTLVFVVRGDQVLLIHKKTGLGAGNVNGPGGKVEPGEGWVSCARREVREELEVEVGELTWAAELQFLMSDYHDILCQVFIAHEVIGEPTETREAKPMWCALSEIPWAQMWADDQYWLPRALLGERVLGRFSFEGERLLSMSVTRHPEELARALPQE